MQNEFIIVYLYRSLKIFDLIKKFNGVYIILAIH